MNKILLLSLLSLALCDEVSDDKKGPAAHPKHYESTRFCVTYFPWDEDLDDGAGNWIDNDSSYDGLIPQGVSDCVDTLMWDKYEGRYYDRCCYVRFQLQGKMHGGCIALTEEQFSDISESIRKMENGDKKYWVTQATGSKIYQLDCNSSYLKILSLASIILALVF